MGHLQEKIWCYMLTGSDFCWFLSDSADEASSTSETPDYFL